MFRLIRMLIEARKFKTHKHIKISGAGVASTTSEHYMNSPKCQLQAAKIREYWSTGK